MRIKKRDGRIADFDSKKIVRAITAGGICSLAKAEDIANTIEIHAMGLEEQYGKDSDPLTVEQVQDLVEKLLMTEGEPEAAKHFILYRAEHARARAKRLRPDVVAVADYTHLSKYSRFSDTLGRRETWEESVDRRADMDIRRFPDLAGRIRDIYDQHVKTKRVLPSMRSMQFGGAAIEKNNARMFNCSFTLVDRPRIFAELFFLLLSGAGVGYSVQHHHVIKLPKLNRINRRVIFNFTVPDTIEGWADALNALVSSYMGGSPDYVEFNYSEVRWQGAPLKTSGGLAPGHVPLKTMLEKVRAILDVAQGRRLKPIEAHDICCLVAEAVLAGGIRRSSLISLFSPTDYEMMDCKTGNWFVTAPWRAMSNNSAVFLRDNENRAQFEMLFDRMRQYGEPGFCFTTDKDYGMNPCGEIGLDPRDPITGETGFAFCNLNEINGSLIKTEEEFYEAAGVAAFMGTLQAAYTDFPYLTQASRNIANADALLGVGITGMMDGVITRNPEFQQKAAAWAATVNMDIARKIGINRAARVTCVKPSGTASLLLGCVGSGHHPHHARRYIRRITANAIEPVFQYFRERNPHMVVEKPNGDFVIEFPVEAPPDAIVSGDLGACEFMEQVFSTYDNWIKPGTIRTERSPGLTHNVSCTVIVKDDEWEAVADMAWQNRSRMAAMSFLPATGDKIYPFAPREAVTTPADEARFNELIEKYVAVDWTLMREDTDTTAPVTGVGACEGAACEVRSDRDVTFADRRPA